MHIRSIAPLFLFAASMVACSGTADSQPSSLAAATGQNDVVGGKSDSGKDPAVVALNIGGQALCSGTLIGKRAVLTARHCVSQTDESVSCPPQSRQVISNLDPSTITVLIGNDINTATAVALGAALAVPDGDVLCNQDMAVLLLDREVTAVAPVEPSLDETVEHISAVRVAGFGLRSDSGSAGKKYTRADVPILSVSLSEFMTGEVSCSGDSGGPAFDDASGRVVGVVSRGGPTCQGAESRNVFTRVDAFSDIIRAALKWPASSTPASASCDKTHKCPSGQMCGIKGTCEAAE